MTGCAFRRYEQFETSPETIKQELRPGVEENYCIDDGDDDDNGDNADYFADDDNNHNYDICDRSS